MRLNYTQRLNRYPHANHYIRDAIRTFEARVMSIVHQVIPILIILSICGVIKTSIGVLIGIWVGYQLYLFVSDIIDELIDKHDQKENNAYYAKFNKPDDGDDVYDEREGE